MKKIYIKNTFKSKFFLESEYGEPNKILIILESEYGELNKILIILENEYGEPNNLLINRPI